MCQPIHFVHVITKFRAFVEKHLAEPFLSLKIFINDCFKCFQVDGFIVINKLFHGSQRIDQGAGAGSKNG